ncbi:MAG: ABC transporter permease, partial [Blastocatellia bacterium]|nr:ABC transporter permease [Blastocatellia bacterium]
MHSLWQDLRYGARMLMKRRGTTIVAVVTLALGIGANTSIFSAVNAVLLRPLPYDHPEQLVAIYTALPSLGYQRAGLSEAEFVRLRRAERSFIDIAGWNWDRATLRGLSEPERVAAPLCTANLFRLLGVRMALGRDFSAEEETAGKNKVAVLAYSFWRRKFSGDPAIIGRRLEIDGEDVTVIGVLPTMFKAPFELQADTSASADLWRPVALNPSNPRRRGEGWSMTGIGRLRPGVTIAAALAEHNANVRREAIGYPQGYPPDSSGVLLPLERAVAGDLRLALLILVGAVAVVLLIACVNVANLLLVSGEDRRREIALRAALGASRGRIVRQLLIESTLLSVQGGILGLLLAIWGVDALLAISPKNIPRLAETSLDHRVLYFTLLVSLAAAVIFGLAPALRAVRFDLHTTLKESGRGAGPSSRLRQSLVVLETTLAVILLVAAGLLFRSFWKLQRVELGFQPDHLLTMRLTPGPGYSDNKRIAILYEGLISRVSALPGVESAAVIHPLPINNTGADTPIEIEFDKLPRREKRADFRTVSSAYFQAMGMRMVQGRSFTLG